MTKIYGEAETKVRALDNVSFSVKKGEFVLVIGSSGSGKSTLLNMIGLLDKPTEGKVLVDGFDTSNLTDNEISTFRNKKLGFVFQFANLLADLTVLENVLLPSQIQFDSTTNNKAKEILEKVGLKDQLFKRANKIFWRSGSEGCHCARTGKQSNNSFSRRAYGKLGLGYCKKCHRSNEEDGKGSWTNLHRCNS